MGYLGQKYDKGLVIQRSPEGSAFQEEVNVVADGDTEVTPKVGGGLKKVNISGGGGTEVIPNPELEGDEEFLSSVGIGDTNYKLSENDYTNNDKKAVKTIGNYVVEEYSDPQGNYNLCSFEAESIVNYVYTRLNFAGVDPNEFDQNIWSEGLLDLKNLNKLNKYKFNFTLTPTINNIRDEEHTMHVSLSLDDFDLDISDANACDATVGELRTINNFFENISASVTIGCVLHIETDSETGDSRAVISNFYAMIEESILSYDSDLVIDHIAVVYPENGVWFGQNNYPTTDGDYVLNVDGEIPSYKKFAVNPTLEGGESNLSGLQIGDTKYTVPQGTNVVANPTLAGTEANLTGLQVGDTKYAVPQGTNVVANPTLVGTEANLNGLQVGNTKYKVGGDSDIIPLLDSTNTVFDDETSVTQYGQPILIEDNSEADTSYQQAFLQMIKRVVGDKFSVTPFYNETTGEEDAVVDPVFISIPFKKPIQGFYDYEYEHGHIQDGESHTYAQLRTKTNLLSIYIGSGVGTGGTLSIDAINYSNYELSSRGGGIPRVLEINEYELDHTYGLGACDGGEYEGFLWAFFDFADSSNGMWINENPLLEGNVYITYNYKGSYSSNPGLRTEKVALTAAEIENIRHLVTAKVSKCDVHSGS